MTLVVIKQIMVPHSVEKGFLSAIREMVLVNRISDDRAFLILELVDRFSLIYNFYNRSEPLNHN
jgi:hypothetical protein